MNRFILTSLIISLGIIEPLKSSEIISVMSSTVNPEQFIEQVLCPSGSFDLAKARSFFAQMQNEAKNQYGIELDINLVVNKALKSIEASGQFSESEIRTAQEFYSQLLQPEDEVRCSNKHKHKKHKKKYAKKHMGRKGTELVLPDKMCLGFVAILSGALLCMVPFGQGVGTGLIATGIYSVLDGAKDGEKPYYVNSETGEPIKQNSD